jgi:hypothetical protein
MTKKYIIFVILFLISVIYLGIINHSYPKLLFIAFIILSIITFFWILMPLLYRIKFFDDFKNGDYSILFKLFAFCIYTAVIILSVVNCQIVSSELWLIKSFLIIKIIEALLLEFIIFLRVFTESQWPFG